jgi:hypothetical protein
VAFRSLQVLEMLQMLRTLRTLQTQQEWSFVLVQFLRKDKEKKKYPGITGVYIRRQMPGTGFATLRNSFHICILTVPLISY